MCVYRFGVCCLLDTLGLVFMLKLACYWLGVSRGVVARFVSLVAASMFYMLRLVCLLGYWLG